MPRVRETKQAKQYQCPSCGLEFVTMCNATACCGMVPRSLSVN